MDITIYHTELFESGFSILDDCLDMRVLNYFCKRCIASYLDFVFLLVVTSNTVLKDQAKRPYFENP